MGVLYTPPPLQEAQVLATCKGPKKIKLKGGQFFIKKMDWPQAIGGAPRSRRAPAAWAPSAVRLSLLFFASLPHFFLMWSTPPHWLQHMPTLARPCQKTSNIHNFWSVGPNIMKFVLKRSLRQDASLQKVSKNLKIVWGQATLTKTGLVTLGTYGPLGVNH
jgi:hypothetical protein